MFELEIVQFWIVTTFFKMGFKKVAKALHQPSIYVPRICRPFYMAFPQNVPKVGFKLLWSIFHSMAGANLKKSEELVTNTTTPLKYTPKRTRICINLNPYFQTKIYLIICSNSESWM